jgi:hypothetical protein
MYTIPFVATALNCTGDYELNRAANAKEDATTARSASH